MRRKIAGMGMWGNVVFIAIGTALAKFLELRFPEKEGEFGFTGPTLAIVGGILLMVPKLPWFLKWTGIAMILESDTVQSMITSGVNTMLEAFPVSSGEMTTGGEPIL